jgi:putative zinc finger/helix-turn-helix YgiT family protein
MHLHVCDVCGIEQAHANDMRDNKRKLLEERRRIDGLLSGNEIRAIRKALGVNQAEAAKIFGGGPVAFSKYESGDVTQSESMDKLLRVAFAVPRAFSFLAALSGELKISHRVSSSEFQKFSIRISAPPTTSGFNLAEVDSSVIIGRFLEPIAANEVAYPEFLEMAS